jgi:outer membrane receptor for ferrienterochelin and colicin
MFKNSILLVIAFLLLSKITNAQTGIIKGQVKNISNNEPIPFANIGLSGTNKGVVADIDGNFMINELNPGYYNIQVSSVGFKTKLITEQLVTNAQPTIIVAELEEESAQLKEVEITTSGFTKTEESPISLRTLSISEIERNPGSNRDISNVIRSLPGVASTPAFRNDIIIRGGAPNENRFYLDGVEVPNINHFSTQGSSGGPVGLINVNFIREVDYYSGAFPANRGNALSSVFEFKQKDGRNDKLGFSITSGATDFGLTAEGPLGKNTTFIASARRSYLQFLFKAIGLPFLPIYNDFQFKVKTRFSDKDELTLIGLGAIDNFELNLDANETENQRYILNYLPIQEQWNYTNGAVYKRFFKTGYHTFVLSRNMLNNTSIKYKNNDDTDENNLILRYVSQEIENKFRYENVIRKNGFKIISGALVEYVKFNTNTLNNIVLPSGPFRVDYKSDLSFYKYGIFAQLSKGIFNERILLSGGFRMDGNSLNSSMRNMLNQLSPRFSISYSITEQFSFNTNVGMYYQLPAYTVLGYKDNNGNLLNVNNGAKYINNTHYVAGFAYETKQNARFTAEGFYKQYKNYPFLTNDSISLANLGGDFGVIGNEPSLPISEGRSYGAEFLAQQKLIKGFFGILAYTYVISEFKNKHGVYTPTAWDSRNIINATLGKKFNKNWQTGLKFRYSGGQPYTPFNLDLSSQVNVWDIRGRGIEDFNQLNSQRLKPFHGLDIRVDKFYYLKKATFDIYLDIQNLYNFQAEQAPIFNVSRNNKGEPLPDPTKPGYYQYYLIPNTVGTVLPTIGVKIDF